MTFPNNLTTNGNIDQSRKPLHITEALPGVYPWFNDNQAPHARQYEKESLGVVVICDPSGMYAGRLDYHSWALSAIANQRRRWGYRHGRRVLGSADPQHFADGARFLVDTQKSKPRLVEIVNGRAVDYENGQWLVVCEGTAMPAWEAME